MYNSLKYTSAGTITLKFIKSDKKLGIIVSDTGIGIPVERLKTIFIPLVDNNEKRLSFETGIGFNLYLVKSIINIMGGDIYVQSIVNQFTSFFISFPLEEYHKAVSLQNVQVQ